MITAKEITDVLLGFVEEEVGIENIVEIEANCGTIYMELKNGSTKFMSVGECEIDDEDGGDNGQSA